MKPEQIQQWAREAGATFDGSNWCLNIVFHEVEELQAFTKIVRNATLEEAAQRCDAIDTEYGGDDVLAPWCSRAIRSMKS
jgi:hypothetical protein